jgi:hypothetical protein
VPTKSRNCSVCLKKTSMVQRARYSSAMVRALHAVWAASSTTAYVGRNVPMFSQTQGVCGVGIEQREHVACLVEPPRIDVVLPRQHRNHVP